MEKYRPLLVTLHGINSLGAWQEDVRQVFEPHFLCVPLHYSQFRRLGWLKIFFPWLRRKALKTVAGQFSDAVGAGVRPHLIAHSFGTWLAARLMKRPGTRLDRVVFVGSPLSANFNWAREMADNPGAFYDLTNERGLDDGPISLAGLLGGARAGRAGFRRPPELIHDTGALRDACPLCHGLVAPNQVRIHNLDRRDFGHSDWFVGNGHSAYLWLPYFWGFPPEEYSDFIESCLVLDEMEGRDSVNLRQAEEAFHARAWSWTRVDRTVVSLGEYVTRSVIENLRRHQRQEDAAMIGIIADRAVRLVWSNLWEAIEERRKPAAEQRENIVRRLHPQFSITAAVDAAVRSWSLNERPGDP
jgi:pimeloyl-ACP methyl ester carboxylesterase